MLVHGALGAGHVLGVFYNLRRRNHYDAAAHVLAAWYDAWAALRHYRALGALA